MSVGHMLLVARSVLSTACSQPGTSVHGILQERVLEWVAISFSRGSSRPRDRTWVSCIAGRFFVSEPPGEPRTDIVNTNSVFLYTVTNRWGNNVNSERLYFLGSKLTSDGDCSHEIKRCLLLGRKAVTNLDSILKSRDITLLTKVHLLKAMVYPVVMYGY